MCSSDLSDVNGLVDRFTQAQKVMRQMAKGGSVPGLPPMPVRPMAAQAKAKKPGKGAKKSGNPAKRAAQAAGIDVPENSSASGLTALPDAFKGLLG